MVPANAQTDSANYSILFNAIYIYMYIFLNFLQHEEYKIRCTECKIKKYIGHFRFSWNRTASVMESTVLYTEACLGAQITHIQFSSCLLWLVGLSIFSFQILLVLEKLLVGQLGIMS